jgi:hypothetical protein
MTVDSTKPVSGNVFVSAVGHPSTGAGLILCAYCRIVPAHAWGDRALE